MRQKIYITLAIFLWVNLMISSKVVGEQMVALKISPVERESHINLDLVRIQPVQKKEVGKQAIPVDRYKQFILKINTPPEIKRNEKFRQFHFGDLQVRIKSDGEWVR